MATKKINYEDKVGIQNEEDIPRKNKVMDDDMNEIKEVVNHNSDELTEVQKQTEKLQQEQGTTEGNVTKLESRISTLEKDNTQNKKNISNKVDKVEGKGLSTNDFTNELKSKLEGLNNYDDTEIKKEISDIKQKQKKQDESISTIKEEQIQQNRDIELTAGMIPYIESPEGEQIRVSSSRYYGQVKVKGKSEQEVRSGKNVLNINSSELYKSGSATTKVEDDKISVTSNNNPVTSYASIPIDVKPNTDYTLSGIAKVISNSITEACSAYVKIRDEKNSGNWVSNEQASINKDSTVNQDLSLTFNSGEHTRVWVWLYIKSSGVSGVISIDFSNLQVEEGATKTNYEKYGESPSPEYPSPIQNLSGDVETNVDNVNILPQYEETKETQTVNGVTITKNNDGTYTLDGTSTGIVDLILFGSWVSEEVKLRLSKGMTYFKTNSSKINGYISFSSKTINKSFSINANSYYDNQIIEDVSYAFIRLCTGAGISFNNEKVIFELSYDDISNVQANEEQTIVFPLSEGQKMYAESSLEDDGIHHVRNQVELNEIDDWRKDVNQDDELDYFYFIVQDLNIDLSKVKDFYCTHFKYSKDFQNTQCFSATVVFVISIKKEFTGIIPSDNTLERIAKFKNWLLEQKQAGTPVILEYDLKEETIEPYTEEQQEAYNKLQKILTYYPETNVRSNQGAKLKLIYKMNLNNLLLDVQKLIIEGGQ